MDLTKIQKHGYLRSNGCFSIFHEPYEKKQHPNQQCGLDWYVDIIDHSTGRINSVKLYMNTKGLHFKKDGTWYLDDFTQTFTYIPFQMIRE